MSELELVHDLFHDTILARRTAGLRYSKLHRGNIALSWRTPVGSANSDLVFFMTSPPEASPAALAGQR